MLNLLIRKGIKKLIQDILWDIENTKITAYDDCIVYKEYFISNRNIYHDGLLLYILNWFERKYVKEKQGLLAFKIKFSKNWHSIEKNENNEHHQFMRSLVSEKNNKQKMTKFVMEYSLNTTLKYKDAAYITFLEKLIDEGIVSEYTTPYNTKILKFDITKYK